MKRYLGLVALTLAGICAVGCVVEPTKQVNSNGNVAASPTASASVSPTPANDRASKAQPVTFPVLDAFLNDKSFTDLLSSRLQLTNDQIAKLKDTARSETIKLNEANAGAAPGESASARSTAREKIRELIGDEKAQQLEALIAERWTGDDASAPDKAAAQTVSSNVPTDSRVVVNAPAYRMDVFEAGKLIKSYKIGIGYPQFPLPTGLRKARVIIFNPTWTPPDEPWVAKMKNVSVGEKVEAGSKLNPLGPVKIPIGGPSLIHGGKPLAKIGTFASHGCVGLTTPQVHDFAKVLSQLGGAQLTDTDIAAYERNKTETKEVKLKNAVPIELRYETIVVEDGKLHIYRDVYDQETNTEENLKAVLEANGIRLEDVAEDVRAEIPGCFGPDVRFRWYPGDKSWREARNSVSIRVTKESHGEKPTTRATKNQKEIVIEIAALSGKVIPRQLIWIPAPGKAKVKK